MRKTMQAAAFQRRVPVLVAYNVPYRDCGQFSAGGATNTAEYVAWIDGVAKGIGSGKAVVILEPDGLGIIPYNVDLQGVHEWCQPPGGSSALADARYVQMNAAVDRLEQQPRASVYLDGTHSNWLGSGEAGYRLVKGGVLRAQGFFVNASNYQPTPQPSSTARGSRNASPSRPLGLRGRPGISTGAGASTSRRPRATTRRGT